MYFNTAAALSRACAGPAPEPGVCSDGSAVGFGLHGSLSSVCNCLQRTQCGAGPVHATCGCQPRRKLQHPRPLWFRPGGSVLVVVDRHLDSVGRNLALKDQDAFKILPRRVERVERACALLNDGPLRDRVSLLRRGNRARDIS